MDRNLHSRATTMPHNALYIIILFIILYSNSSPVLANTYYVSPTGNSSWSKCHNIKTPCSGKTAALNAKAGDTVLFRGGTYDPTIDPVPEWSNTPDQFKYETLPWNPKHSGREKMPITFKAYPGEMPVILDNVYGGAFGASNRSWIIWDGFSAQIVDKLNTPIQLVVFNNASHCIIKNSKLTGVRKATHHNAGLVFLTSSNNILITNNIIQGMSSYQETDKNYIELANNSSGILNFYSYNVEISNNDLVDNFHGIWDKDAEKNNRYSYNHIWSSGDNAGFCSSGIIINNKLDKSGPATGISIYNNIIRNCTNGIILYEGDGLIHSPKIHNNTLISSKENGQVGVFIMDSSVGARIYNNIIFGFAIPLRYYKPLEKRVTLSENNLFYANRPMTWYIGWESEYRSLYSWKSSTSLDKASISEDPLFISRNGNTPDDFKLSSTSPAQNAGLANQSIGALPSNSSTIIGYRK